MAKRGRKPTPLWVLKAHYANFYRMNPISYFIGWLKLKIRES